MHDHTQTIHISSREIHEHSRESARRDAAGGRSVFAGLARHEFVGWTRWAADSGSGVEPGPIFLWLGFLANWLPWRGARSGTSAPHNLVPKPTPANLRRFAETPVARRAINVIKDRIVGMRWRIQPRRGRALDQIPDGPRRVQLLTENFEAPNPDDSFRSLLEQVLEDVIVGGFGAIEIDLAGRLGLPVREPRSSCCCGRWMAPRSAF